MMLLVTTRCFLWESRGSTFLNARVTEITLKDESFRNTFHLKARIRDHPRTEFPFGVLDGQDSSNQKIDC